VTRSTAREGGCAAAAQPAARCQLREPAFARRSRCHEVSAHKPLKGRGRSGSKGRSLHILTQTAQATGASLQGSPSASLTCEKANAVMLRNSEGFHGHSGPQYIPAGLARCEDCHCTAHSQF